ncbi:MAG: hypothetical protein WCB18_01945 [Thermoplasmata archaeon]
MNSMEEPVPSKHRSQRVVSLPCGHHVYVDTDASLIAVSGPVLDHQSTCRGRGPLTLPAWFAADSYRSGPFPPLTGRPLAVGDPVAPLVSP